MPVNGQYSGADPFGGPGGYASTGAAGSPGAVESDALPDSAFTVPVSQPYQSAQGDLTQVAVGWDDVNQPGQTVSYTRPDPLTGVTGQGQTGAGDPGASWHSHNPNSESRPRP